jgi:hypothetical protein
MNVIFHFIYHIWDVILPIDQLIFFKMVIAPPSSYDLSMDSPTSFSRGYCDGNRNIRPVHWGNLGWWFVVQDDLIFFYPLLWRYNGDIK